MTQANEDYPSSGTPGLAFALGVLSGAAIGVALGLLFAPKDGAAMRHDIARRSRDLRNDAGGQLDRMTAAADDLVERGRDVAQRARTAVSTGIREARRQGAAIAADLADVVDRTDA